MLPLSDQPVRIGVLMWTNKDFARRVLSGILEYANIHGLAEVRMFDVGRLEPSRLAKAGFHGLISILDFNEGRHRKPRVPHIRVARLSGPHRSLSVTADACLAGTMAAEHLMGLRMSHYTIVRGADPFSFAELEKAYALRLQSAQATFIPEPTEQSPSAIQQWMRTLPPQTAILCQSDGRATTIVRMAMTMKREVPDDLAILGIENDTIVCMGSHPTLSSITLPAERMGFIAGEMLHRRILGHPVQSVRIPPTGIVLRASTNVIGVEDPVVAAAVLFIRAHFNRKLKVVDVARHVGISRRALEYRFGRTMQCGVHDEFDRCRLERATSLLSRNNHTIKEIAATIGMTNLAHFNRFIKHHTELSPRDYRAKHQA
jgi:LacI family transcriptional regulator